MQNACIIICIITGRNNNLHNDKNDYSVNSWRLSLAEMAQLQYNSIIVRWIRARRLAWLGHILRLGPERKIKQAVFEMFKDRSEGDLLMDAPQHRSWRHLCSQPCDRERWRVRVRAMKQIPIVSVTMGPQVEEEQTMSFTMST